ncbi:MAG: hypothetical protein RIC85_04495 [Gammaproteobacteria bacterium]
MTRNSRVMRRAIVRSSLSSVLIVVALTIAPTPATGAEFLPIDQFGRLVSDTANEVRGIVKTLEDSTTAASFNVRSDLLIVLQNLERISENITSNTLDRVDETVQSSIVSVRQLVKQFNEGSAEALDKVRDISVGLGETMSRVPGISEQPFVTRYSPSLALASDTNAGTSFLVEGTLLGNTNPNLQFGSRRCSLKTNTERIIEFHCADGLTSDSEKWASGELILTHGGWFDLFFRDQTVYRLSVRAIPHQLGDYELVPYKKVTTINRVARKQRNGHRNPHCSGNTPLTWTYNPAPGCIIDLTSAKAEPKVKSSKSSFGGIHNLSATGFQVRGSANNNGKCAKIFGQPASKDGRGALHVLATWTDLCKVVSEKGGSPIKGKIQWGSDVPIALDPSTSGFRLTIRQSNGDTKVVTGDESGGIQSSASWFDVKWQPKAQTLVVSPRALSKAFR